MDFSEKLQTLRKGENLTQEELANRLYVSRQAVSKWEAGQTMPDIDKIIELAKMYNVSLDYLLTDYEKNGTAPINGGFSEANPMPTDAMLMPEENTRERATKSIRTMGFILCAAAFAFILSVSLNTGFYSGIFTIMLYIVASAFLFVPKIENWKSGLLFLFAALFFSVLPEILWHGFIFGYFANMGPRILWATLSASSIFIGIFAVWVVLRIMSSKHNISMKIKAIAIATGIIFFSGILGPITTLITNYDFYSTNGLFFLEAVFIG